MIYVIFIIPLLMIVTGYLMFKYPPKKINWIIGYRTFKAMKNEKVWKFANQYCGKLWIKIGLIMVLITSLLFVFFWLKIVSLKENILLIIVLGEVSVMLLSILLVENKIKDRGEENGY